ncbi:MAG: methylmalonyl Co-A mutase-associated GTPase MeaB [Acidimicrobiia bacterium]|nr:methylmalonyl Co-A mutase-associated GTPase MeaB [Acidimicrobiia bacterium]
MPASRDPSALVAAVAAGDRRALARLITLIEEDGPGAGEALRAAFGAAKPAYRVGITGAPGAGKSTLTDGLIRVIRASGDRVAALAVDPTSPFSGGSVLGDRVRMQDHVLDPGVYIRSMATRGHLGGLSVAAPKALLALEAAGYPWILVETVGVGQDEVEVTASADTVVVVVTPGWGDGIQAAKAGILEIGDVFVVNKSDRPGAAEAAADLRAMLALAPAGDWTPPIVETVAAQGVGITGLWEAVEAHRRHLGPDGLAARIARRRIADLDAALIAALRRRVRALTATDPALVAAVERGEVDPWTAAARLSGV